jgi:hypothetical protein
VYIGVLQRAWLDSLNIKVQSCFMKHRCRQHAPVDRQWLELHKSWFVTCHVAELVGFVRMLPMSGSIPLGIDCSVTAVVSKCYTHKPQHFLTTAVTLQ